MDQGCSWQTYAYLPGFVIVTEPDSPGLIAPVLQDPSRAEMTV
jgi:hypothetical protein